VPYVRTVKTKSGATAVQVVYSSRRGSRDIEHIGSAHDEAELEVLKAAARQLMTRGQLELGLELDGRGGGDEVFRQLVLARIIEPASKLDSIRVLEEAGVAPPSYRTIERRLRAYAQEAWRQRLSAACAAHAKLGPASLALYDVSTLLCRRRHNRVYADLLVMPMFGVLPQVRQLGRFLRSAYS
jgi:hypothetical protein